MPKAKNVLLLTVAATALSFPTTTVLAAREPSAVLIYKGNFCLDVPNNDQSPGKLLHLWQCEQNGISTGSMLWTFHADGTITSTTGLCLDNVDAKNANGNGIQLQRCNGNSAQKWQPLANGALANVGTGNARCLNLNNNNLANNERIQLWDCNNADGSLQGGSQWSVGPPDQEAGATSFLAYRPNTNFALDTPANGPARTAVDLYTQNGTPAQQWTWFKDGSVRNGRGLCLDNTNGIIADGNPVQVFDCNQTPAQKWIYRNDGTIFNLQTQRCLDNDSGRQQNGNKVQMWTCQSGNAAQTWQWQAIV
ncbi:ricin B lectin domain-containing protein [Zopfochytrium polystomum]|nr:ricin B lectin domain-containing protein [Zopfochytrium polystomum]